jgi:hypothetical protein
MPLRRPQTSTPSQPVRYLDFMPDADPTLDGNVQGSFGYFPVEAGYRTFPGQRVLGTGLPSQCLGAFSGSLLTIPTTATPAPAPTNILAAATNAGLYIADNNGNLQPSALGFTNVSNRWRFSAYGQDLLAVNGVDPDQFYRLASGVWAPLPNGSDGSTPPIASIVETTDYGIILVTPNSQSFLSSLSDTPISWLGSVPNQVYIQPITQTPGSITAVHRLRNTAIFYKRQAMHVAYFNGGTIGWDVQEISLQVGTYAQECVINTGDMHYFVSNTQDFWSFDGWNLNRLPNHLAEFFRRDLDENYATNIAGQYDEDRNLLIWHYPSKNASPAGSLDSRLIFYLRTQRWAFERLSIDLPIPQVLQPNSYLGYFGTDHAPHIYDETIVPGQAYIISNLFGDYLNVYELQRARPAFAPNALPDYATLTALNQNKGGVPPWIGPTEVLSDDGFFNLKNTARLQSYQLTTRGLAEVISLEPILIPTGDVG